MKPHPILAIACLLCCIPANAQSIPEEPTSDAVLEAIREFNRRDRSKPNEVTVVLEPPATVEPEPDEEKPLLVTGKAPENATLSDQEPEPVIADSAAKEPDPDPAVKPNHGLAIKVEKIQTGSGTVAAKDVKLSAPFPAKPLDQTPLGWKLDTMESAPPFSREVEIAPGSMITLTIRPHCLIPEADGATSFSITEPGYDPSLGYDQTGTVGATLSHSINHLDADARKISTVIDQLQQLLVSLPRPEEVPVAIPAADP